MKNAIETILDTTYKDLIFVLARRLAVLVLAMHIWMIAFLLPLALMLSGAHAQHSSLTVGGLLLMGFVGYAVYYIRTSTSDGD